MLSGRWVGLNVTIPHKRLAAELADVRSPRVARLGVANTLVRDGDGRIVAENTDVLGFSWMLARFCRERLGSSPRDLLEGRKALVLGSGGASQAVCYALEDVAGARVTVVSRTGEETYETILERHADAALLVNTTPVGMYPACPASPLDDETLSGLADLLGVLDVVYNPRRTGLVLAAERLGLPAESGLAMLVAQALYASELFQGRELDERLVDSSYEGFLSGPNPPGFFSSRNFRDEFGSFFINRSAWVEPPVLMEALERHLESTGILRRQYFDVRALKGVLGGVDYCGLTARAAIFCGGFIDAQNPFFKWLNFRPAKGEILSLELLDGDFPDEIVHKTKWIMRSPGGFLRMGSTWDRIHLDSQPTEAARSELLGWLEKFFVNPKLVAGGVLCHTAAVRPCTATTRPFVGFHPLDDRIAIFNGFGSKGFALSPYFARMFAEHIALGRPLDPICDIRRTKCARVSFGSSKNVKGVL